MSEISGQSSIQTFVHCDRLSCSSAKVAGASCVNVRWVPGGVKRRGTHPLLMAWMQRRRSQINAWMEGATKWRMQFDVAIARSEDGSSEADTETVDGASVCEEESEVGSATATVDVLPDFPFVETLQERNVNGGLESLDEVDLVSIFIRGANVMRSVLH